MHLFIYFFEYVHIILYRMSTCFSLNAVTWLNAFTLARILETIEKPNSNLSPLGSNVNSIISHCSLMFLHGKRMRDADVKLL